MKNLIKWLLLFCLIIFIIQCRFDKIIQPKSATPGEIINITVTVSDAFVPEPNAHKGVLGILIPQDWKFVSGEYRGTLGKGILQLSKIWADSIEKVYPASTLGKAMRWIALLSDSGYAYEKPITINVNVKLKVGEKHGCFDLAYLVTKATPNLINTTWTPLSFPYRIGVPDSCMNTDIYKGKSAPGWGNLFNRKSGWTGSDACYSIPLNGMDHLQYSYEGQTLFLFGDTFIGSVDSSGRRHEATFINNSYAILNGPLPDPQKINFFWHEDEHNKAQSVFIPQTANSNPGNWYWPMDGVVVDDSVYVFALRLKKGADFPFEPVGVSLISFSCAGNSGIKTYRQKDTPLFLKNKGIVMGQAVMPLTAAAGYPNGDGYIYVYGPKSGFGKKDLLAARVLPKNISDFSLWKFWDGNDWTADMENCAPITGFISQEFSVTPLPDGKFLLTFQIGDRVAVRIGDSPVGPFDIYRSVWNCPEMRQNKDIFVYNAKAHPHLSPPGKLLISYNVNSSNSGDLIQKADIYRPRFITIDINRHNPPAMRKNRFADLFPNYPNPFLAKTKIKYYLRKSGKVKLEIFNILGQKIRTLVNQFQNSNTYIIYWDGQNSQGIETASGIYIYRLKTNNRIESGKMVLLR